MTEERLVQNAHKISAPKAFVRERQSSGLVDYISPLLTLIQFLINGKIGHFTSKGASVVNIFLYAPFIVKLRTCMKTECVISGTTGGLIEANYCYKIS